MKYILFNSEVHDSYGIYNDVKKNKYIDVVIRKEKSIHNKVVRLIKYIHLSGSITKYINIPYKHIWYENDKIILEPTEEYTLLFDDLSLKTFSQKTLDLFTKESKCILILLNSMDSEIMRRSGIRRKIVNTKWHSVYTFDIDDVKKYDYRFLNYHYYSKHDITKNKNATIDIVYIGALYNDRKKLIYDIYDWLNQDGIKVDFHLQKHGNDNKRELPYSDRIHYFTGSKGRLAYEEIISLDMESKTILEVVQERQSGPTLRYFEAVVYNRKLLTNNPNIVKFPFYDCRYMRVYTKPEDIDIKWVKEDTKVDYGYTDEFSPVHLLEEI